MCEVCVWECVRGVECVRGTHVRLSMSVPVKMRGIWPIISQERVHTHVPREGLKRPLNIWGGGREKGRR